MTDIVMKINRSEYLETKRLFNVLTQENEKLKKENVALKKEVVTLKNNLSVEETGKKKGANK